MPCLLHPLERSSLDFFLWALQLHRNLHSGAKDGQQYKILNAAPETKEKSAGGEKNLDVFYEKI